MSRPSRAIVMLVLFALLPAGTSAAAAAPPRARLRGFGCNHALDPAERAISVKAVMRPLSGTVRMELKFELLVAPDGHPVPPFSEKRGDLGEWRSPKNPTLGQLSGDVWNFTKSVIQLGVPATYRFRVSFRWRGARNHVIDSAVQYSSRCHLIELRPDLLVESPIGVSPAPGQPNRDLYTTVIDNNGASAAGPFVVQFAPGDGSLPQTVGVQRLDAGASVTEMFMGLVCTAGTAPTVTADSTHEVDDLNRANNSLLTICPATMVSGAAAATRVGVQPPEP